MASDLFIHEDFYRCMPEYGMGLDPSACTLAVNQLPVGSEERTYSLIGETPPYNLPLQSTHDGCTVSVEINGPRNEQMESISLQPDEIRDAADYIVQQCPRANGMGGFITQRFSNLVRFFTDPSNNLATFHEPFPPSSYFMTITVGNHSDLISPGNTCTSIPSELSLYLKKTARNTPSTSVPNLIAEYMMIQEDRLSSDKSMKSNWFDPLSETAIESNAMNYTCNNQLDSPRAVDCEQILETQLGFPGDIVTLNPGLGKSFTFNTCNTTITSDNAISVTWAQVRSCLEILVQLCIETSGIPSVGGRVSSLAHSTVSTVIAALGTSALGQKSLNKRAGSAFSGLPALPEGVSIIVARG